MGTYLNPGKEKFKRACMSDIYIDKSELIIGINQLINKENNCISVSRPRRFGKSMTANMLAAYYDKECDSSDLFDNLKIAQNEDYKTHLNKYNVIALNIQDFVSLIPDINQLISYIQNKLLKELRKKYASLIDREECFLSMALSEIYEETQEGFIFIIDEWDCILRDKNYSQSDYEKYLDFIRNLFKDKAYVSLVYMTGILPIKKYGTHSALNMFDERSMIQPGKFAQYIGFTETEVAELCERYRTSFESMKEWYDGYRFRQFNPGATIVPPEQMNSQNSSLIHIYNPKSVVDSIRNQSFASYWTLTETYEALRIYIDMNFQDLKNSIVSMIAGDSVKIDTGAFQNDMQTFSSKDDVLTLLIHLGYLSYDFASHTVRIPNTEIRSEFIRAIKRSNWTDVVKAVESSDNLLQATWNEDCKEVARLLDQCHEENSSILTYNDENSLSCVISLAYYNAMNEYTKIRELPTGKGFADIVFLPKQHSDKPAMIVELKYDKTVGGALQQIHDQHYPTALKEYMGNLLLVGINYNRKSKKHECIIEKYEKEIDK